MPLFLRTRDSLLSFSNKPRQSDVRVSQYLKLKAEKMQKIEIQTLEQSLFNFSLAFLDY